MSRRLLFPILSCLAIVACRNTEPTRPIVRGGGAANLDAIPASNAYGLNMNPFGTGPGASVASLMNQGNIGWVRSSIYWYEVESMNMWGDAHDCYLDVNQSRNPDTWSWPSDAVYDRAMANGLNLEFVLFGTPCNESTMNNYGEETAVHANGDMAGWALFVQRAVDRYPNVKAWGIWNEPNEWGFYKGAPGLSITDAYAELVRVAAPIIHAAGGSLVGLELADASNDGVSPSDWITNVFQAVGDSIDILGLHEYNFGVNWLSTAASLARSAAPNSPGASHIWLTEVGTPSNPSEAQLESHVSTVVSALKSGSEPAWKKMFYWNGYTAFGSGDDRNVFFSDGVNPVIPKVAYQKYRCAIQNTGCTPLGVSFTGLTTIHNEGYYSWTTSASGGTAPYSYMWERSDNGGPYYVLQQGGTSYSAYVDHSYQYFILRVTAASGIHVGSAVKRVNFIPFP